jgi:hypothetical protein
MELQDTIEPYFWSETELLYYIDEAQVEFCRQGTLLKDSRTPEICHLAYKANDYEIPTHESIMRVLSIVRQDDKGGLHKVTLKTQENTLELYPMHPRDYGVSTEGARQLNQASDLFDAFVDYDEHYIRLSSPAVTAGTLLLQVERLPKDTIESCDDELEIRKEYVPALLAWSCFRAWSKQDAETFDEKAAATNLALFEDHASRAKTEQSRRTSQAGIMKYGGL